MTVANLSQSGVAKLSQSCRKIVTKYLARFAQVYVTLSPKPLGGKPLFRPPERCGPRSTSHLPSLLGWLLGKATTTCNGSAIDRRLFLPDARACAFRTGRTGPKESTDCPHPCSSEQGEGQAHTSQGGVLGTFWKLPSQNPF